MAKKKYNCEYGVVVWVNGTMAYVYKTEYYTAHWSPSEQPKRLSKDWAREIAMGLVINGYQAFVIEIPDYWTLLPTKLSEEKEGEPENE